MNKFLLSFVLPCYNEEQVIKHTLDVLITKMKEYQFENYEMILIDDGSKDSTLQILEEYAQKYTNIKIVSFAANRGQQVAIYAGICYSSGDAVVLMDADLQDPPECIPEMIRLWQEGWHVVYGKRAKRKGESIAKKITSYLFYRFLNHVSETKFPENVSDFRLMDRVVADAIINMPENNRFNRAIVSWLGFKQTELVFDRPARFAGETKYNWLSMLNLAKDAIFSFSYAPIQLIQNIGIFSILGSIILIIYTLVSKFTGMSVSGWSSLMIVITFFSGSILFSLGIIGEYIARIHTEVIKRPLFITAKTVNLKDKQLPDHITPFISARNSNLN